MSYNLRPGDEWGEGRAHNLGVVHVELGALEEQRSYLILADFKLTIW